MTGRYFDGMDSNRLPGTPILLIIIKKLSMLYGIVWINLGEG
jgi:hypothetical protein